MQGRLALWILLVLAIVLLAGLVFSRTERLTDGVWTVGLPVRCALGYRASVGALALACPGVGSIRIWPLPVEHGWAEPEDTARPAAGQLASEPMRWT